MVQILLLSILSGLLLPLALPNELFLFGFPLLGCFCLAPYFFALARCATWKGAVLGSVVFAFVSTPLGNFWLAFFKDFALLTIGSVSLAYSILFIGFGTILWKFSRPSPYRPLLLAAFWMVYEFIKSTGYFAYPWGLIVYPINTLLPALQIADIAGIWPLSFLMALINALSAETLLSHFAFRHSCPSTSRVSLIPHWLFALILAAAFTGYGLVRMSWPLIEAGKLRAVLVQQNTDPWLGGAQEKNILLTEELSRKGVAELGGKADIIIWSESSITSPYAQNMRRFETYPSSDPFVPFVRSLDTCLLTGSPILTEEEGRRFQNGVILLDGQARIRDSYGKRHPVPMAEHIPLWEYEPVRKFFQDVVGIRSIWALGDRDTIFIIQDSGGRDIRFGSPICFEDAFPYLCRNLVRQGADILINLTNDAWSRTNSAQVQHFVVARFRSIEMKRILIRSTNGGLTAVIGPFGEIQKSLPMFKADYLAAEIPILREDSPTPYTLYGDYLPIILGIFLIFLLVRDAAKREKEASRL
jgi:apolipoprotein N-acyltransferase